MPHPLPSAPWTAAYAEALAASEELQRAATGWQDGAIALVFVSPDGDGQAALVSLDPEGAVTARHVPAEEARDAAALVLEASVARWHELAGGGTDPIKFFMQGKLALTRGPLATLLREVAVARQLLLAVQRVPTAPI